MPIFHDDLQAFATPLEQEHRQRIRGKRRQQGRKGTGEWTGAALTKTAAKTGALKARWWRATVEITRYSWYSMYRLDMAFN